MAKAKDFTGNAEKVRDAIRTATDAEPKTRKPRKTYTPEEAQEQINQFKTAGRKGVKMPRINLAFSQENYDFVHTMAQVTGMSLTEYCNRIIARYAEEHKDLYRQALRFRDSI